RTSFTVPTFLKEASSRRFPLPTAECVVEGGYALPKALVPYELPFLIWSVKPNVPQPSIYDVVASMLSWFRASLFPVSLPPKSSPRCPRQEQRNSPRQR